MSIMDSATKKIGPLPAWAWAGAFAGGVYYYRKHESTASSSTTTTGATDQLPSDTGTILQPGESVVGPDGSLTTAPGGDSTTGESNPPSPDSGDPSAAIAALGQTIAAAIAAEQPPTVDVTVPGSGASPKTKSTAKRKAKAKSKPKLNVASVMPFIGRVKPRSPAAVRTTTGGRTTGKKKPQKLTSTGGVQAPSSRRTVKPTASSGTRVRNRATTPAVAHTGATQHPVATHPKAKAPAPAPKPVAKPKPAPRRKPVK